MLEIVGYALAVLIGFTLGLLGGGGSILTVPVLVYVLGIEPVLATGYSLFVVGVSASVGAIQKAKNDLLSFSAALWFGLPSLLTVFATRAYVLPAIPKELFTVFGLTITKSLMVLLLFALLMFAASVKMIWGAKNFNASKPSKSNFLIGMYGLLIGFITALVGAGGGFLIVPALVLLLALPIKKAMGTSLLIIAVNCAVGFSGDVLAGTNFNWHFLLSFSALAIAGMFAGTYATKFIDSNYLRKVFGWFILLMAIAILASETLLNTT